MLRRTSSALAAAALLGAGFVLLPINVASGGIAPTAIEVDTVIDDGGLDACTPAPEDCSLRGAFAYANENQVGGVTIDVTVPAGEYALTDEIYAYNVNVNVHGAGVGSTIVSIDRTTDDPLIRHLQLNPDGEVVVTLSDMTFVGGNGEQQDQAGGSILSRGGAELTLRRMHFLDNEVRGSGGAVAMYGNEVENTLVVEDSTFAGNGATQLGGAIHVSSGATAEMTNSTFTGNVAAAGGAIFVGEFEDAVAGSVALTHVTVAGNAAEGFQGDPQFGAIGVGFGAEVTLEGTLVEDTDEGVGPLAPEPTAVGDPVANCWVQDGGSLTSAGHNLADDATCNLDQATDQPETAADAQVLADNGGPTFTMALLADSDAVDTAGDTCAVDDDQRGTDRPQDGNSDGTDGCDVGAFERAGDEPPPPQPAARPTTVTPRFTG